MTAVMDFGRIGHLFLTLLFLGCGGESSASPSSTPAMGGAEPGSSTGGGASAVMAEPALGIAGSYEFGTRSPWGSASGTAGSASDNTVAAACVGYASPVSPIDVPTDVDCEAVASNYARVEHVVSDTEITCFTDGSPQAWCRANRSADPWGDCGGRQAWSLESSNTAFFGTYFSISPFEEDYSAYGGIALWARLSQQGSADITLELIDRTGAPVIDPATGKQSCYYDYAQDQDWDGDGIPNLTPPPESIQCQGSWRIRFTVDGTWRFFRLPWSLWEPSPNTHASALDPRMIHRLHVLFSPCRELSLQMGWVGAYRSITGT